MSNGLLYHGFGVRDYRYLKTEYVGGRIRIHIEKKRSKRRCANCQSRKVICKGKTTREIQTIPIGSRRVFLVLHLHRFFL